MMICPAGCQHLDMLASKFSQLASTFATEDVKSQGNEGVTNIQSEKYGLYSIKLISVEGCEIQFELLTGFYLGEVFSRCAGWCDTAWC